MYFENDKKGNGTSTISDNGSEIVEVIRLDEFLTLPTSGGLLWLDVEGHATKALGGMKKTLNGIDLAKIEIQMHQMSEDRPQDFVKVIKIMREAGLIPINGPIHPGYFGDLYFVRTQSVSLIGRILSLMLRCQMQLLHRLIYPLLGKPRK